MLNYMATMFLMSGENPSPLGNAHFVHVPYNTYNTSDGFIIVAVIFDSFWERLVNLLDIEQLRIEKYHLQPGRLADRAIIDDKLNEVFRTKTTTHWIEQLNSARIPCAPVNQLSDTLSDPQVLHRHMVVKIKQAQGDVVEVPGNPIKLSLDGDDVFGSPPLLGQHTDVVLADILGYPPEKISALHAGKVVA